MSLSVLMASEVFLACRAEVTRDTQQNLIGSLLQMLLGVQVCFLGSLILTNCFASSTRPRLEGTS